MLPWLSFVVAAQAPVSQDILTVRTAPATPNARTPIRVDPIEFAFLSGSLDTSSWSTETRTADKDFTGRAFNNGYALAEVDLPSEKVMLLEASGDSMVWVNGEPRGGDIYSYGYVSLPVRLHKGKNQLLFTVIRGSFRAKLLDPPAPVSFDLRDATTPDIVKDERAPLMLGLVVRNALDEDVSDLSVEAGGMTTKLPRLMSLTNRKVMVQVKPNGTGAYTLNLKRGSKTLDSQKITLRIRGPHDSAKRTFLSRIDNSVQYYAVNPSRTDGSGQALFLSLHGASVEALGQAEAYSPKAWGHIVCPTNRRPYGFNWEDMGRLDALEVLDLARAQYKTDPSRTYLTGHSMGGHGTYHLGVLYPDKFAAIAPCSGWVSYFSYANGATYPDSSIGKEFQRAMAASDTLSMKQNYMSRPIFIQHGEMDDNVPVSEARNFRAAMKDHPNLQWNEEKGQGHWYDTDPEPGANCEDYAPIFDMFAKCRIPWSAEVRTLDFCTPNLAISDTCYWVQVRLQDQAGDLSTVHAKVFPGLRKFEVTTTNVGSLSLDSSTLWGSGDVTVVWNGLERKVAPVGHTVIVSQPRVTDPGQSVVTGFKSVFDNHLACVVGTSGSKEATAWGRAFAKFISEQLWVIGNGAVDIVTDVEAMKDPSFSKRNLLLLGGPKVNKLAAELMPGFNAYVSGEPKLAVVAKADRGRAIGIIGATDDQTLKFAYRIPLFTAGAAIPDYMVLKPTFLKEGLPSVVKAGFWPTSAGAQ